MIIISKYYQNPLSGEARQCEIGRRMIINQALLRAGSGVVERVKVRTVRDDLTGRYVTFELLSEK